jgi:hypothetical protein
MAREEEYIMYKPNPEDFNDLDENDFKITDLK